MIFQVNLPEQNGLMIDISEVFIPLKGHFYATAYLPKSRKWAEERIFIVGDSATLLRDEFESCRILAFTNPPRRYLSEYTARNTVPDNPKLARYSIQDVHPINSKKVGV